MAPALALLILSASAVWFVAAHGWTLYYGDAEAHLDIARRIVDSERPGYEQVGTVWLPLPHWMMLPLVGDDARWRNGMAGAIPASACFVIAGVFFFAAVRRIFDPAGAAAAVGLFALNPNALYLQAIPMTEAFFWAALMAVLYFTVVRSPVGAGLAACAATLIRYDGWFLLPFVAIYFWMVAGRKSALLFALLGGLGPVYWVAHNWYLDGHPLDFLLGPYSAVAIQGGKPYPGLHNWRLSWTYVSTAARLCAGSPLAWIGIAGVAAALIKRAVWPVVLLSLPPAFYIWSMHSSGGTPIFIPTLPPFSYYNTRYGLEALPLLAFGGSALVAIMPARARVWAAAAITVAAVSPWLLYPTPQGWVTWEESSINSEVRRALSRQAAEYLGPRYHPGARVLTSGGDLRAIFREAGISLRETRTEDSGLLWLATVRRPCLYSREEWAVTRQGDAVEQAIETNRSCLQYHLEKVIEVKNAAPVKIYRR